MDSLHFSPTTIVFMLILFFVLLFVSAFFSLSETAFFSLNKTRLDFLIKQKNKRAISIFNIINEPDRLLSTILTGNNIVNIIVSKDKIVAINADMSSDDIVRIVTEEGHTRYPVYRHSIDNVIGIIHSKAIINMLLNNPLFVLEDLMMEPYFVPEDKKISKILAEFRQKGLHIAIVRDAQGDVSGLIQIKDILKVIFGELNERTFPD